MAGSVIESTTICEALGYLDVPTDRTSNAGEPVNALFAVARGIQRGKAFKTPARAIAVVDVEPPSAKWPALLLQQLPMLPERARPLGMHVVEAHGDEVHVVASYARAALDAGDDVVIVGIDKRYAQLVSDRLWWYDANKDARYTPEMVHKRFLVDADKVAEWLALVGDDDQMPGIAGIGAKGATGLLDAPGSVEAALAAAPSGGKDAIAGRSGNALRAAGPDAIRAEVRRATLDTTRPLPLALDAATYAPASAAVHNAMCERLGFVELL